MRTVLLAALVALALAGCSNAKRPLIQVGSQKVTVEEFVRAGRGAEAQYPGTPEVAKDLLLEDMVRRTLMLELAHQLGHERSPAVLNTDAEEQRHALVRALYAGAVPPAQRVSEAETRALYEARKQEAEVYMIYTSTRESSLAALARLDAGEPFEAVSRAYSMPGLLPPNGAMGMIAPGSLPEPLDGAVRRVPIGKTGGPYETREGWFLVKITKRVPHEQGTYESLRVSLADLERQRKQRAAFTHIYQDMKAERHFQLVLGGSQLLFRISSPVEPLQPTPAQRRMPLATYDGGEYTLQDALDDMQNVNVQRPQFQLLPAIELWVEQQAMTRVMVLEARRRHLDEEPDLVSSLRGKHEQMLLEGIYQNAVATVPPPGPELVRMAWERLKNRFTHVAEAHLNMVVIADSMQLVKLVREGQNQRSLVEAVKSVDPTLVVVDTTVRYPNTDPAWNAMLAMFTQMQPGAWYGPEPQAHGWRVLQLVNKIIVQQAFEELPPATQQNIASSAGELARDARFQQFTDSLKNAYKPQINRELLAKVPWPIPVLSDASR